ncbi:MAG: hypothetical protein ABIO29_03835 [Sphingomicrobium sp.]
MAKSPVLPVAYVALRLLVLLNWVYGAIVASILVGLLIRAPWLMTALGVPAASQTPTYLIGLRTIAALGLLAIPLNLGLLKRLIAMVGTVRSGDPFIAENAYRLQAIAWLLVGQQILSTAVTLIGRGISTPAHNCTSTPAFRQAHGLRC